MKLMRTAVLGAAMLVMAGAGSALASDSALTLRPQADAAILPVAPDLERITYTTPMGTTANHNEGIVIRQSRIEDGKIIIPPAGIFYTNRGPRDYMLRADILNMLGQPYYLAKITTQGGVVADLTMKPGDRVFIFPDRALWLKSISPKGNGHPTPSAVLEMTRANGSAVRALPEVNTTPYSNDYLTWTPWGKPTGVYPLDWDRRFDLHNWTMDLSIYAGKYVKVDNLTDESLRVVEAFTHRAEYLLVSKEAPVTGYFGVGDSQALGDWTATVKAVDQAAGTATVSLTHKDGRVVEKTLGPIPEDLVYYLGNAELETRTSFMLNDPDETVQVELAPHRRNGLFNDGKVGLNMYADLQRFEPGMIWPSDSNWTYRPDT